MLSQSYSDATKGKEKVFHYVCFKVAQYYELKVAVIAIKLILYPKGWNISYAVQGEGFWRHQGEG